ncbi:MAG: hypothetical protein IPJ89_00575 [Candidatus Iainarchaeum archaeon]|uniref:Uncharacterized protein n=1 Tax=Candidatus Iainarchaeum sp. TaxID=3101447 RepID=A0A7T9I1V0_9ARCH|nr:MAG: hypothetical protein IPJ89_00575 [Candidatus Diapherotrites archaeon]
MRKGFWKRLAIKLTPHRLLPRLGVFERTISAIARLHHYRLTPPTARRKNILKYGKPFIELFPVVKISTRGADFRIEPTETMGESPIGIGIFHNAHYGSGEPLAQVKIGFEKHSVIVEAIQGTKPNANKFVMSNQELMHAFKKATGMTWPRFLIAQVEKHAAAMGFKRVKIIKPEKNPYYEWHLAPRDGKTYPQSPDVQRRMKALYYGVARNMHYRAEGNYLVKELGEKHGN